MRVFARAAASRTGRALNLSRLHVFEFGAAGRGETTQQINRAVDRHFPQFEKGPVGLQIGIQDFSRNFFGMVDDFRGRQRSHPAQLRIETYQTGNISFIVLKRVDVAFGGLLDEILVEDLLAPPLISKPLGAELSPMVYPIFTAPREAAAGSPGQEGKRGDN